MIKRIAYIFLNCIFVLLFSTGASADTIIDLADDLPEYVLEIPEEESADIVECDEGFVPEENIELDEYETVTDNPVDDRNDGVFEEQTLTTKALYVSPKGKNSWAGDINHPLATIQKAIDKAEPGTTIYLREGTYTGKNTFVRSGNTKDGYITITSYKKEKAVVTTPKGKSGAAFAINSKSYIKIKNIKITNMKAVDVYGILMKGGEDHIYIENCEFSHIATTKPGSATKPGGSSNAILLYGEKSTAKGSINHVYIIGNKIHDNVNGWSENVSISGNCEYVYVKNNKVYNNTNIGIDFYGNAEYCSNKKYDQPRHCVCSGNTVYNCNSFYAENAGIYVDGAYDVKVTGNNVYKNCYGIEIGSEEWRKEYTSSNRTRSIRVSDNKIHDNSECGIRIGGWTNDNTTGVVYNCVISGNNFGKNGGGTQIIIAKCDKIRFEKNTFPKNARYKDVVEYDDAISPKKITNISFDTK